MYLEAFSSRLLPGERIVWSGRPGKGIIITARDTFLIPFSLVWFGFTVFWESSVWNEEGAPSFFILWGAMFMTVGLYMVVGRFVGDAWVRSRTSYALTDQRVLIMRSAPITKFSSVSLARLPELELIERSNGRGTIRFGQQASMFGGRQSFGIWSPALDPVPQFLMIDDVRRVFDLAQQAAAKL